jgi:uncharacterized SAM-binding protein YcdF (DUF218 family)
LRLQLFKKQNVVRARLYRLGVLLVILLLAVGGCRKAGIWLVRPDHPQHADAMIMLMGGIDDRVPQTADLYKEKVAGKVWIVKAETGGDIINYNQLATELLVERGVPLDSIVTLPGGANSTRMEAEIIRDYLVTRNDIDTLLLVTSPSHTRRAYMIFRAAFKPIERPVVLYSNSSSYATFHARKWWRNGSDIERVVTEYMKLVNFYLFERGDLRRGEEQPKDQVQK